MNLSRSKIRYSLWGHKLTDVDAFGAAMGIYRAALALEKRAYIVINEVSALLRPLYELFEQIRLTRMICF